MNNVNIVGNLGVDPELRKTQSGHSVVTMNVATNRQWTNKNTNEKQKETTWWRVVVWGAQAENCAKFLAKGRGVAVQGHMVNTRWTDDKGVERFGMELQAREVEFLSGGGGSKNDQGPHPAERGEEPPWAGDPRANGPSDVGYGPDIPPPDDNYVP